MSQLLCVRNPGTLNWVLWLRVSHRLVKGLAAAAVTPRLFAGGLISKFTHMALGRPWVIRSYCLKMSVPCQMCFSTGQIPTWQVPLLRERERQHIQEHDRITAICDNLKSDILSLFAVILFARSKPLGPAHT